MANLHDVLARKREKEQAGAAIADILRMHERRKRRKKYTRGFSKGLHHAAAVAAAAAGGAKTPPTAPQPAARFTNVETLGRRRSTQAAGLGKVPSSGEANVVASTTKHRGGPLSIIHGGRILPHRAYIA